MGIQAEEYLSNRILGNVRTGKRGENDRPIKLDYFDVHLDKSTSSLAIEIFNSKYNKPKSLKIKFVKDKPFDLYLERYEGRKRKCFGNNEMAKLIDDKGKEQMIKCDCKTCEYKKNKKCKYIMRIYARIYGLEEEGIWSFQIKSEQGISNILLRIARAKRLNEDISKDWYEIFLNPVDAPTKGLNYIPDIRKVAEIENKNSSKIDDSNKNSESNKNNNTNTMQENYIMLKGKSKVKYNEKDALKMIFINTKKEDVSYIILPEENKKILDLKEKSIILPLSVSKRENIEILNDFKLIKEPEDKAQKYKEAV